LYDFIIDIQKSSAIYDNMTFKILNMENYMFKTEKLNIYAF